MDAFVAACGRVGYITIGLMTFAILLPLPFVVSILRIPNMPLKEKRKSLLPGILTSIQTSLIFLMVLGDKLHWPMFAQAIIRTLFIIFLVWSLLNSRRLLRHSKQKIAEATQHHANVIERLRREGIYPAEGQVVTDDDIKRLLTTPYGVYAMGLYQKAHQVNFKEAAAAIKRMRQELKSA